MTPVLMTEENHVHWAGTSIWHRNQHKQIVAIATGIPGKINRQKRQKFSSPYMNS